MGGAPAPTPPGHTALEDYDVELDEVEDGVWSSYFCNILIARFNERDHSIRS